MLLYHRKTEYSRVYEVMDITEEGMFMKDGAPDDYGGAVLQIELVHEVTVCDASGYLEVLKFDNPKPLNKDKEPAENPITLDGKDHKPGSGEPRVWTTRPAPNLPPEMKAKVDEVKKIMESDGEQGTRL